MSRPTPRLLSFALCLEWINGIYNTPDTGCLECYRPHASVNTTTPKIDRKQVIALCAQCTDVPRLTSTQKPWTKQRCTRRSFQGSCYSQIDLCKPRLVGVHHGSRPPENGVCHPPWSAFRLLHHQPGFSSRTRRGSR